MDLSSVDSCNGVHQEERRANVQLYSEVCENIRQIMAEVVDLKLNTNKDEDTKAEITELRIQGSLHFLTLKQLNRSAQIGCKEVKDRTQEAKQKLDGNNLQLENLRYEINHLNKEITKCLEFRSRHDEVPLVSVDTFYQDAPPEITDAMATKADIHMQTLARLDYELLQRKQLAERLDKRGKLKEKISDDIGVKKQHLQELAPEFQNLLKASLPLQECLNVSLDRFKTQHDLAKLLPRPLFVLFLQARAYQEACDDLVQVAIGGDEATARIMVKMVASNHMRALDRGEDSDSDIEETDEIDSARGHKRRSSTKMEVEGPRLSSGTLAVHPLHVVITVGIAAAGPSLELVFQHLTTLNLVTVRSRFIGHADADKELLNSLFLDDDNIIQCLNPDDDGIESPSPSASIVLSKSTSKLSDIFHTSGRPYVWAQKLCGLEFLSDTSKDSETKSGYTHMQSAIAGLRNRVKARISLSDQTASFKKNLIPSTQNPTFGKTRSKLSSWKQLRYSEYKSLSFTKPIVEFGLLDRGGDHFFFLATLTRGPDVTLQSSIVISSDYPNTTPLVNLLLQWRGDRSSANDMNIREIECDLNMNVNHKSNEILTIQLLRLMRALDVYMETEDLDCDESQSSAFPRIKVHDQIRKGPARLKPFLFDSDPSSVQVE